MKPYRLFKDIRKAAFNLWMEGRRWTESKKDGFMSINVHESMEAKIQFHPDATKHINIICSMNDFSINIYDLLGDHRYDKINITNDLRIRQPGYDALMYRFYTRIYLVAAEIFSDLAEMYLLVHRGCNVKQARRGISNPRIPDNVDNINSFINNVFKHKAKGFHFCNKHLNIFFEDAGEAPFKGMITIQNCKDIENQSFDGIVLPKLSFLIQSLLTSYSIIEKIYSKSENIKMLNEVYGV